MTHRFYIVRHGNTFDAGDTVTRVGGRTDLELSSSGEIQARALAEHFATVSFDHCISSPLRRTWQTATAILSAQAQPPEIHTSEMLREIDYGPDENLPEDQVRARIGTRALDAWENRAELPDGWRLDIPQLIQDWRNLFARAQPGTNSLVVTSNGIARFALLAVAGHTHTHSLKLKTGAYGIVTVDKNAAATVTHWNLRP